VFIVEVTCLDFREEGTGPNKKLAKRAAAEAMLHQIGYIKPMPLPGKSLLKKKEGKGWSVE
jgi:double-stranded RNA-binding protein Staufen